MKKNSFLALFFVLSISISAQNELLDASKGKKNVALDLLKEESKDTTFWTFPGVTGLNFSQTAFVNWAEGGQNSISGNALAQLNANYRKNKLLWNNNLSAEYGMFYSQANTNPTWRKTSDRLGVTSNFGYQAAKHWFYAALIDFRTQFNKGYDYQPDTALLISSFLTPGYLIASIGMNYIPNEHVSFYLSPTTARFTFVRDTTLSERYGLDAGKRVKSEFGAYATVLNNFDIMKDVHLNSRLELFSAYETFGNVVVNWEVLITMKVNKYVNASVRTQVRYDDAVKSPKEVVNDDGVAKIENVGPPKVQFMDMIAVGFSYNF